VRRSVVCVGTENCSSRRLYEHSRWAGDHIRKGRLLPVLLLHQQNDQDECSDFAGVTEDELSLPLPDEAGRLSVVDDADVAGAAAAGVATVPVPFDFL
jgi:hypothetical protein